MAGYNYKKRVLTNTPQSSSYVGVAKPTDLVEGQIEGIVRRRKGKTQPQQEKVSYDYSDFQKEMIDDGSSFDASKLDLGPPIEDAPPLNLSSPLYGKKGTETGKVASNSYYDNPIPESGYTRNAGGAPKEAQEAAIKEIIRVGRTLEATPEQIAYALATARYESGFNIYAAAKSTSAYGLGQFIDATGEKYGLNESNMNDLGMQAQALIEHTIDNFDLAERKGYDNSYVYALHHDGPSLNKGGLALSKEHIMPFVPKYKKLLETYK